MDLAPLPRPGLLPAAYQLRWADFLHLYAYGGTRPAPLPTNLQVVNRHSAALLYFDTRGAVAVGSAVPVRHGGRHLLATAGHNLAGANPTQLWAVLDPRRDGLLNLLRVHACRGWVDRGADGALIDVGWVELAEALPPAQATLFLPSEQVGEGKQRPASYIVQGVPARLVRVEEGRENRRLTLTPMTLRTSALSATIRSDEESDEESDKGSGDIALDYRATGFHPDSGRPREVPPAPGLSGGGIWALADGAQPCLVGITRGWWPTSRQLRGTPIHHWLERVDGDFR